MRTKDIAVSVTLGLLTLAVPIRAVESPAVCSIPQSPRNIDPRAVPSPYNGTSTVSIVKANNWNNIIYKPRGGGPEQTLYLCGMHYHDSPENAQGCRFTPDVEVHYVYASRVKPQGCDFRHLDCCLAGPFVVIAEQYKLQAPAKDANSELGDWRTPHPGSEAMQYAEWSGSTTGPDHHPGECKSAAQWSFVLFCDGTIDPFTLKFFFGEKGQEARALQSGARVSRDLTLVTPRSPR